jgi:hypothetical protein
VQGPRPDHLTAWSRGYQLEQQPVTRRILKIVDRVPDQFWPVLSHAILNIILTPSRGYNDRDWHLEGKDLLPLLHDQARYSPDDTFFWRFGV